MSSRRFSAFSASSKRRALRAIRPDLVHAWGTERGAALVIVDVNRISALGGLGVTAGVRVESVEVEGYGYVAPRTYPAIADPVVRAATVACARALGAAAPSAATTNAIEGA